MAGAIICSKFCFEEQSASPEPTVRHVSRSVRFLLNKKNKYFSEKKCCFSILAQIVSISAQIVSLFAQIDAYLKQDAKTTSLYVGYTLFASHKT